jgi:Immunity protein family (Imm11)
MTARPGAKIRRLHTISWSYFHGLADFEVENLDVLLAVSRALHPPGASYGVGALYPPLGRRGFPAYPEKPRVVIGTRRKGPPPSDIELFHSYWLISGRLKSLFHSLDPQAFAFQACHVTLRDGAPGPEHWLCDVVRVIEAFDELTRQELSRNRNRFPALRNARALAFDEAAIDTARFFRTPQWISDVFCDQGVKVACKAAGMKGLRFVDCTPKRRRQGAQ